MNTGERLLKVLTALNYSKNGFAVKIGVSATSISNILDNKVGLTYKMASTICDAFPNISLDWLLKGEGEMFVTGPTTPAGQVSIPVSPTGGQVSPAEIVTLRKENEFLRNQIDKLNAQMERLLTLIEALSGTNKSQLGKLLGNPKKGIDTLKQVSISVTPRLRHAA